MSNEPIIEQAAQSQTNYLNDIDSVDVARDDVAHFATARVETPRASRYLRALCNHFDRKVQAEYTDDEGHIHFPFGECELHAETDALLIHVSAGSEEHLARTRHVVADHLVRFAQKETLQVDWSTTATFAPAID